MAVIAQQTRSTGNRPAGKGYPQKSSSPAAEAGPEPEIAYDSKGRIRSEASLNPLPSAYEKYGSRQKAAGPTPRTNSGRKPAADPAGQNKPEPEILFQKYFKSVGPRTYASQLKRAGNGNHFLVLTEAKRDDKTNEVRKTRLYLFSEDFVPFFRMLHETAQFIRQNPVPDEIRKRQERRWSRKAADERRAPAARRR